MFDQHHDETRARQPLQKQAQFDRVGFVQSGGRLVQKKYGGCGAKGTGDLDQPTIDMRQRGGKSGLVPRISDQGKQRTRQFLRGFAAPGAAQDAKADIIQHAQGAERLSGLECAGETGARDFMRRLTGNIAAADPNDPGIRPLESTDQIQQRRFPRAIGTDHTCHSAGRRAHVDARNRNDAAKCDAHAFRVEAAARSGDVGQGKVDIGLRP